MKTQKLSFFSMKDKEKVGFFSARAARARIFCHPIDGSQDFHSTGRKNQAMLLSIEHDITLVLLFSIAFKCILNVY